MDNGFGVKQIDHLTPNTQRKFVFTFEFRPHHQTFWLGSRWVLGLGLTNSEFNSIHFGVEIKKKKIL